MGDKCGAFCMQNKLNFLWDSFVNAENKSYEKGAWLDAFLGEFLAQISEGKNVKDIISFSDSNTISTLIACELLLDVHGICSRPGNSNASNNDGLLALKKHLLSGRGWMCLAAIHNLEAQDISCARQLTELLISLYKVNSKDDNLNLKNISPNPYIVRTQNKQKLDNFDDVPVRFKLPSRKKSRSFRENSSVSETNSPPGRYHKSSINSVIRRSTNDQNGSNNNDSSESENEIVSNNNSHNNSPQKSNIKIRLNPMDFDYFTLVVRSDNEKRLDSESYIPGESKRNKMLKLRPEDFYDERIEIVLKAKMNTVDLKFLIINILQNLLVHENLNMINESGSFEKFVSVQMLSFVLDVLCSAVKDPLNLNSIDYSINVQIKRNLNQLLLSSFEKFFKLPDITSIVLQKGILPIMRRILEDILFKYKDVTDNLNDWKSQFFQDIEFLYSLLYSSITLLHCLLLQNNTQEKLNQFLSLFHEFNMNKLIDRSLILLLKMGDIDSNEKKLCFTRTKTVIYCLGNLIAIIKKTIYKISHSKSCKLRKHKNCSAINDIHHHEPIFGKIFTDSVLSNETDHACCIATLFMVLSKCLTSTVDKDIVIFTLYIMIANGTCCCFPSQKFITRLINVIEDCDQNMKNIALILLERTYYRQFGAFNVNSSCDTCFKKNIYFNYELELSKKDLDDIEIDEEQPTDVGPSSQNIKENNTILCVFRNLFLSSDPNVVKSVASHLLSVTTKCNLVIQKEILFTVYYPAFVTAKKRYFDNGRTNENDIYVLTTCLSAFTNLLSRVRFTEEFLKLNALKHVEELLLEPEFIRLCCSIIEIAVIVQVFKCEIHDNYNNNRDGIDEVDVSLGIEDLDMFLGHVKTATISLLKSVNEHHESNSSSISSSFVSVNLPVVDISVQEGIEASESFINDTVVENNINDESEPTNSEPIAHVVFSNIEEWDSFHELLENCSVLWRTCANITMYSPQIRKYFSNHSISKYSYDLLWKTLDGIAKHTSIKGETSTFSQMNTNFYSFGLISNDKHCEKFYNANQVTLKLFESLLILNLISPVVDERTGCLMTEDALLSTMRSTFIKTIESGHVNLRQLCDVLLRASTISPSNRLVLPTHKMPKVGMEEPPNMGINSTYCENKFENISFIVTEDTSLKLDELLPNLMALPGDEGYEADIELLDRQNTDEKGSNEEGDNGSMGEKSMASSRKVSVFGSIDMKRDLIIMHPGLCIVTVNLLSQCLQMHELNSLVGKSEDDLPSCFSDTIYCFQRLAALCQESIDNCRVLNKFNVLYLLLTLFKTYLVTTNSCLVGLQHAVLKVITILTESSIEPKDLCQFLNFFTEDNPPLESLTNALVNIVSSIKVQPSFIFCFPTSCSTSIPVLSNKHDPAERLAINMRRQHTDACIDSCWSCSSIILGINQELGWSMWSSGFSLSMWLCIDKSFNHFTANGCRLNAEYVSRNTTCEYNDPDNDNANRNVASSGGDNNGGEAETPSGTPVLTPTGLLHIVSVGYDLLTLEFWIDNYTNTIIVRVVRSDGVGVQEILAESSIISQLSPGLWHHMAISVKDSLQKRKVCIEVTLLIDGWSESHVSLSFTGLLVRKSRPYCVAIGHHSNSNSPCTSKSGGPCNCVGRLLLGNLMMFRSSVFNKDTATYLSALGPDHTHLTETDVGNARPNFSRLFTSRTLSSGIMWEKLLNDQESVIKLLQENLLMVYSAQTPNTIRLYPHITNTQSSSLMSSILNSNPSSGFRLVTIDKRSSQHLPMCVTPAINCMPTVIHSHTFISAVNTIGGISTFLFLFARIVEMDASETHQARALYLLLKLVQSSAEFNSEFISQEQHKLLTLIISSKKCKPGIRMLKAILDTACDRPSLLMFHPNGSLQIHNKSGAILVNPAILIGPVLKAWRDWEPRTTSNERLCLNVLLHALLVLLREDHPQHEFNAAQLNRVDTVDILLKMCKERFVIDEPTYPDLDAETCKLLVEVIAALMSSPPKIEHITAIVKFLILSHPAQATFVTHMRSSFYFLLPVMMNTANTRRVGDNIGSDDFINRARSNIMSSVFTKSSTSSNNLSAVCQEDVVSNFSVDPVKLNKALSDLQKFSMEFEVASKISSPPDDQDTSKTSESNQNDKVDITNRCISKSNSFGSISTNSIVGSVDGFGCDSGIAGSFKDNAEATSQPHNNIVGPDLNENGKSNQVKLTVPKTNIMLGMSPGVSESSSNFEVRERNQHLLKLYEKPPTAMTTAGNSSRDGQFTFPPDTTMINLGYQNPDTVSDSSSCQDSNIDIVTEGLLLLLRDCILVLPDSKAEIVLNTIMKIEQLIVMANHPSPKVRVAVIKVLSLYLQRATEEELARFLKMKGFYLLANQLYSQEASHELIGCISALITGQHWLHINDQLPLPVHVSGSSTADQLLVVLSPLQISAIPVLLATIQKTVHDPALAHATILFLGRLFNKVSQAYKPLLEMGIVEVLLKTLLNISHQPPKLSNKGSLQASLSSSVEQSADDEDEPWERLLITDIHNTLIMIVKHALNLPGYYNMKVITDLFLVLNYLERVEQRSCGYKAKCVYVLRTCHSVLLANALEVIHTMINQAQQSLPSRIRTTATAFLTSVFSNSFEQNAVAIESCASIFDMNPSSVNPYDRSTLASSTSSYNSLTSQFTKSELSDRFDFITSKSIELIVNNIPTDGCYSKLNIFELNFINDVLSTLLNSIMCIVERKNVRRSSWTSVMWSSRDTIKLQTAKLLIWLLSPGQLNKIRVSTVNKLRSGQKSKEVFLFIFENNNLMQEQFLLYLWDLINGPLSCSLEQNELKDCEDLSERIRSWGFVLPEDKNNVCCDEDVSLLWDRLLIEQKAWWKQQEKSASKIVSRMENVIKSINESAVVVTNLVNVDQNEERKQVMETLRNDLGSCVHTQILWKNIIRQLTHERAVWHFPKSYPRSWRLDPTEGPSRIRNRLQRCHLNVQKRYLKSEFHERVDAAELPRPLSYLFDKDGEGQVSSRSALLIEKLHMDKKIHYMVTAQVITPDQSIPGELLIGETCIYFVPSTVEHVKEMHSNSNDVSYSAQAWQLDEIKEIHTRRFQLKEKALEIFLMNGKTYLLAFQSSEERDKFRTELCQRSLPNKIAGDHLVDAVQLWREGVLTNWEYLTILNKMAGRSYNDLMQYPVMPFILADYTSQILDLTNPNSYRNLKKPMAVQDKKNEQHYINYYNYLKNEPDISDSNQGSYHYGSHYSNSGVVLHFLVRLPPFTCMFLTYQDDNFDLPDRTFHSLDTTWRLTSRESTTDVKEMIPEFYFLPEFLSNLEGFDFGIRQNGEKVDNVALPPWAKNDPRKFILIHRQALESDFVRENIPHWIDLVFGNKQMGKAAVDAINVFHPATYCGFDVESITDPLVRCAWETMVRTYGQTPRQLFKTPHPLCNQSLISNKKASSVYCNVKGVQWGSYVGSPSEPIPTLAYKHQHRLPVMKLIPLLTNDVFGLAPSTTLLLTYSKSKSLSLLTSAANFTTSNSKDNSGALFVHGAAMLLWGHSDGVLRVKMKRDLPPYPIARPPGSSWDTITECTSAPDTNQLWIGYSSGRILVYRYRFVSDQSNIEFSSEPYVLVGHTSPILSISLSYGFKIALTGCKDGVSILWDMNSLSYIRSLPNISMPVNHTCISEITGDLITVGHDLDSSTSILRLHSINVTLLGSITTHKKITAVCFSTAPEGVSVNIIATGMEDGSIAFWSTWDLSPVGNDLVIAVNDNPQPILGLMYSYDSHHLYASLPSGHVMIWESKTASVNGKPPKFLNLSNLSV